MGIRGERRKEELKGEEKVGKGEIIKGDKDEREKWGVKEGSEKEKRKGEGRVLKGTEKEKGK